MAELAIQLKTAKDCVGDARVGPGMAAAEGQAIDAPDLQIVGPIITRDGPVEGIVRRVVVR